MKTLLIALSLLLAGAASAGTILLVKDGSSSKSPNATPPADAGNPHAAHSTTTGFTPDDTKLAECKTASCYEQAFGNLVYNEGPKAAFTAFDEKIRTDRAIEAGCHRIAHFMGAAALAKFDGNVAQAFARGSSSCWSGYYHGILSFAFSGVSSDRELRAASRRMCEDAAIRATAWLAYQCVHGLGHGLMLHTGYNLPYSLKTCDALGTDWDRKSCSGGVFMENITPSLGAKTQWLRDNDLVYPCNTVKNRHKLYCYLMVTSRILQANGYDWKRTAGLCTKVEQGWVKTCFQSLGRDASGFTRQNPSRIVRLCGFAVRFQSECLYGAARDVTSNYANGERASELCGKAPAGFRPRCFFGIGTILGGLSATSSGRRSLCRGITNRFSRQCLRGAGEAV